MAENTEVKKAFKCSYDKNLKFETKMLVLFPDINWNTWSSILKDIQYM